jgi:hypothetical protein
MWSRPRHDQAHLRARFAGWRSRLARPRRGPAAAGAAAAVVLVVAGVAVTGGFAHSGAAADVARPQAHGPAGLAPRGRAAVRARTAAPVRAAGLRTSCRSVAHIGDSTSADLISPSYLPDPAQRLPARYAGVGVRHLWLNASGGRSIVEVLPGQVNGYNVARGWWRQGYRGCWVFALGTNDAANVSVGSAVGLMARIERMMSAAHGEPVLWVNTRTLLASGPWAESSERSWDDTLVRALARYPNMRIFNWAAVAQPGWYLPDGIHYTSAGCEIRARAIADALARAFPQDGHSSRRIVT